MPPESLALLNAKPENVRREAQTIAQAGLPGAVTIATNMAGRGTDIVLGGNPKGLALQVLMKVFARYFLTGWHPFHPPPPCSPLPARPHPLLPSHSPPSPPPLFRPSHSLSARHPLTVHTWLRSSKDSLLPLLSVLFALDESQGQRASTIQLCHGHGSTSQPEPCPLRSL